MHRRIRLRNEDDRATRGLADNKAAQRRSIAGLLFFSGVRATCSSWQSLMTHSLWHRNTSSGRTVLLSTMTCPTIVAQSQRGVAQPGRCSSTKHTAQYHRSRLQSGGRSCGSLPSLVFPSGFAGVQIPPGAQVRLGGHIM